MRSGHVQYLLVSLRKSCNKFFKKNLCTPQSEGKMSNRLVGGIIGCKDETSS